MARRRRCAGCNELTDSQEVFDCMETNDDGDYREFTYVLCPECTEEW